MTYPFMSKKNLYKFFYFEADNKKPIQEKEVSIDDEAEDYTDDVTDTTNNEDDSNIDIGDEAEDYTDDESPEDTNDDVNNDEAEDYTDDESPEDTNDTNTTNDEDDVSIDTGDEAEDYTDDESPEDTNDNVDNSTAPDETVSDDNSEDEDTKIRKYNLYREYMQLYSCNKAYMDKLENMIKNNIESNAILKTIIDNLRNIQHMLYDYMTKKYMDASYPEALIFFKRCITVIALNFELLQNNISYLKQ